MSILNHCTPGDWRARDERATGGAYLIIRPAPGGGLLDTLHIAKVHTRLGDDADTETQANAALLAASKRAVELLVQVRADLQSGGVVAFGTTVEIDNLLSQIRAI